MDLNTFFLLIISLHASSSQKFSDTELYPGSPCKTKDNSDGICTSSMTCEWAITEITAGKMSREDLVRCGFEGFDEIICCKTELKAQQINKLSQIKSQRKSDVACNMIGQLKKGFTDLSRHVTNGIPVQLGEYPHQAALGWINSLGETLYDCCGSLISNRFILTAAHCVNKKKRVPKSIKLGRISLQEEHIDDDEIDVDIDVKNITIHPDYKPLINYHDIALIELENPVPKYSKYLHPACLYTNSNDIGAEKKLYVTGWGVDNVLKRRQSPVLLKGELSFVSEKDCNSQFEKGSRIPNGIDSSQICAFDYVTQTGVRSDACQGDSGGPLNLEIDTIQHVIGVTSFGQACGLDKPGVYTKVSHYLDWIEGIVWPGEVYI